MVSAIGCVVSVAWSVFARNLAVRSPVRKAAVVNNTVRGISEDNKLAGADSVLELIQQKGKGGMSYPQQQQAKAPKRELQGPRPVPLKSLKDSHKIRKPRLPAPAMAYRHPVIIYMRSPEVIHTEAGEFMTLVERLTGRVDTHGNSSMPSASLSIQSQTCHTSLPENPNMVQVVASPRPPCGGADFPVKEDNSIATLSNPSKVSLVQSLTGRVDTHGNSTMPSIQSQTCHTSLPGNPNLVQVVASPRPPRGRPDFAVKEDNPSELSGNDRSQYSPLQSLLSPTIQYGSMSPLSPNFFLPSPLLLSPNIFHEFPLCTPQPDYFYSPY